MHRLQASVSQARTILKARFRLKPRQQYKFHFLYIFHFHFTAKYCLRSASQVPAREKRHLKVWSGRVGHELRTSDPWPWLLATATFWSVCWSFPQLRWIGAQMQLFHCTSLSMGQRILLVLVQLGGAVVSYGVLMWLPLRVLAVCQARVYPKGAVGGAQTLGSTPDWRWGATKAVCQLVGLICVLEWLLVGSQVVSGLVEGQWCG